MSAVPLVIAKVAQRAAVGNDADHLAVVDYFVVIDIGRHPHLPQRGAERQRVKQQQKQQRARDAKGHRGRLFSSRFNLSIQVFSVCFCTLLGNFCHKDHVAVDAVQTDHVTEGAFLHKAGSGVAAAGRGVLGKHAQTDAVQVQRGEAEIGEQAGSLGSKAPYRGRSPRR